MLVGPQDRTGKEYPRGLSHEEAWFPKSEFVQLAWIDDDLFFV